MTENPEVTTQTAYLEFAGISKEFPGVKALDDVSFAVGEGEVRALIGENGAGKSTLLKILSGVYRPTTGEVRVGGEVLPEAGTAGALAAGIAVIYQELQLVPELTVAENLFLGHLPSRGGVVKRRELHARAMEHLAVLGEDIQPGQRVSRLSIGQRQMVEIAKALTRGAKILAFDEPTSSLSDREVRKLFEIIRQLKSQGCVILYVSHRMEEIFGICDSVTVFRDGRHVETFPDVKRATHDVLVQRMVGRDIVDIYNYRPHEVGEPVLEVQDLIGPGLREPVSFALGSGEVLGFFGLVGAGRSELMKLLFGAVRPTGGVVRVDGEPCRIKSPPDAIAHGIAFCPEDRKDEGIVPVLSVCENLNLSVRLGPDHSFFVSDSWERRNAQEQVEKLAIKTPSLAQLIRNLSGGNQQKVILARWLCQTMRVMLLDEPTRGIDVGAKSEIYSIIYDLAERGYGVVVVSSDLPEVIGVCDRIAVMSEGRLVGFVDRADATEEALLKLALPSA
jgi:L-arabinose transport system ATP-binding protein